MKRAAITIRPTIEADLATINAIYNREIEEGVATWDTAPWTSEQRRAWFAEHGHLTPVLTAECDGQVIGFAYASLVSQKHGWRFTREDTIYIAPEFRGQGVGERLLTALLDVLRDVGVRLVIASITSTNEASLRLHRKFGFEVMGEMKNAGYKFGQWMNTAYLQADLGEPNPRKPTW